jgi:hypothetical protein
VLSRRIWGDERRLSLRPEHLSTLRIVADLAQNLWVVRCRRNPFVANGVPFLPTIYALLFGLMSTTLIEWDGPPAMDSGAPLPVARLVGDTLYVAYVCGNPEFPSWESGKPIDHPGFARFSALLLFRGVIRFSLGPPSDERLHEHPLYKVGLRHYSFLEVTGMPNVPSGARIWIATFHDETLEVYAASAEVSSCRIDGEDTARIVQDIAC